MNASYALKDSVTMLRRQFVHIVRYPLVLFTIAIPVVILLLFVYVFGGTMGAGIAGVSGGRSEYLAYLVPGILLIAVASGAQMTSIAIAMDMSEGIIARFRTMSISRTAVLAGHVLSSMLQTMAALGTVVGVAILIGYRPASGVAGWLGVTGLLGLVTFAITWLCVALGLVTKSVETASNLPMPLMLLPFMGSGFVPTETMPPALQWVAENQPFTPIIETLRALLEGTPVGQSALVSVLWCVAIALVGYMWARRLYEREPIAK